MPDVENKLAIARTRLILDKPFLGALVLRLPMVEGDPSWCETTYSDGKTFYYNAGYIDALDKDQTQFALSHEALHCALSHFHRRGHRVKHRWELACDYAVNPLLINDGLKPTPDAAHLREYEGMTAEEIYPCLEDNENDGERDLERKSDSQDDSQDNENEENRDMSDGGSDKERQKNDAQDGSGNETEEPDGSGAKGAPKPNPLSPQEQEDLSTQWQQRLAAAAQTALQNGKLEGEMARMVDFLLQPKLPWRMLLASFMSMTARDDYSYSRPSTRRGDPAVYPSLRSHETNVVVVIDTSGSISADEIQEFISEIDSIKSQVRARITLLTCDSDLNHGCPWIFEPWDEFAMDVEIRGGGGTNFKPAFNWVEDQDNNPDLLMYFTDAEGVFPEVEPMFPVLWLVKGKEPVPFGQRIQLN
ncbi:MAG: VWA-like domain-containing protein [Gammaproteobacteria bacterium]